MNAMLYVRGHPLDYEGWEAAGATGWGWEDIPYGRLRKELRGLDVAIDLVVYRRREAGEWRGLPGTFLHQVLGEGRVLARA